VADWETVRGLARALPEAEEHPSETQPAFSVRGKGFAWIARERDGGGLAVRVDRDEKRLLLESRPDLYYSTPHYDGFPAVLVHLDRIGRKELFERLEDAWLVQAPKRLATAYLESAGGADTRRAASGGPPAPTAVPPRREAARASDARHGAGSRPPRAPRS
jgi:hypothetical protein